MFLEFRRLVRDFSKFTLLYVQRKQTVRKGMQEFNLIYEFLSLHFSHIFTHRVVAIAQDENAGKLNIEVQYFIPPFYQFTSSLVRKYFHYKNLEFCFV